MAEESLGDKTEQATDARREDFRRRGQVAQTRELGAALILLSASGIILIAKGFFQTHISEFFHRVYGEEIHNVVRTGSLGDLAPIFGSKILLLAVPPILLAAVIGVLSQVMQTGLVQVEDAMSPQFERLDPIQGFKKIFSIRGFAEGFKSLLKLMAITFILYLLLHREITLLPHLLSKDPQQIFDLLVKITSQLLFGVGLSLLVLAVADYFFQYWQLERQMMMSKQEIKEEVKQREGDPQIKSRIRRIQRDMAQKRMMAAIPKADVVITNPTHIAVVLKYDANLPAPQLVAKGADLIAERIKAIAREHNIPVIENKPIARTIFKTMKIGHVIPRELFVVVAEILAYVYRMKKKMRAS